jgi:hypothetical protein
MTTPAEIEQLPPPAPAVEAEAEPPSGPAAALILAGGIAVFCMGLLTTLGEASTGIADALTWSDRVGSLSGKTLITVIVFAIAWALFTAWGALIRSSCKSTGFDPRLSLCTHARLVGATRATPLAIQRRPNGR